MAQRLSGFDVVKGAAIVLVVIGHVWRGLGTAGLIPDAALFTRIDQAIYLFHMPVFFFLSGLFFSARPALSSFVKSRFLLVVWPMLLWCWIDAGLRVATGVPLKGKVLTWVDAFAAPFPPQGIYWFLYTLVILNVLAWGLARLPRALHLAAMAGMALAAASGQINVSPFDSLWPSVIYGPAFFAGVAYTMLAPRDALLRPYMVLPGLMLFAIGQAVLMLGWGQGSLFWAQIAMISASIGFLILMANLPLPATFNAMLERLGQQTMQIFLAHILFTAATRVVLTRLGIYDVTLHLGLGTVAGIIGPLLLVIVADRLNISAYLGFAARSRPFRRPNYAIVSPAQRPD